MGHEKRLFKGRKAVVFNLMVVVFTIMVLTYAFIQLSAKVSLPAKDLGEASLEAIAKIQQGESALIFLDFAAKMALYQAVYDIQSGQISETQCGIYYGFPMWNSGTGDTCFVDIDDIETALEKFFVSSLVARVAAYPDVDFVGRSSAMAYAGGSAMAFAPGVQAGVTVPQPGTAPGAAPATCAGGNDYMADFTYESDSGFFPPEGGRVWLPAEANCAGGYPLVIYLHGCMRGGNAYAHRNFGDGELKNNEYDLIPIAKALLQNRKVAPLIMAAPSQTKGKANWRGHKNSPCGASLWGSEFDITKFIELVKANLPTGIQVSSVSVFGHSGAGCAGNSGIYKAAKTLETFAIGQFDTCYSSGLGKILDDNLGTSRFLAIYGQMSGNLEGQNKALGITKSIQCPSSTIGIGFKDCVTDEEGKYFAYDMSQPNHKKALTGGMEQFLTGFFGSATT